jgi:hypothetical protein
MAALSADAKIMADLLAALTHPDTNAIRQAEAALKPLLKNPACVPVLVEVINARETLVRSPYLVFVKCWDMHMMRSIDSSRFANRFVPVI